MKITNIYADGILFDNGKTLMDYHSQDCCENVYADWTNATLVSAMPSAAANMDISNLNFYENILDMIKIKEGVGFSIISDEGFEIFVYCYNIQNGYYSSSLSLDYDGKSLDISDCTKDWLDH